MRNLGSWIPSRGQQSLWRKAMLEFQDGQGRHEDDGSNLDGPALDHAAHRHAVMPHRKRLCNDVRDRPGETGPPTKNGETTKGGQKAEDVMPTRERLDAQGGRLSDSSGPYPGIRPFARHMPATGPPRCRIPMPLRGKRRRQSIPPAQSLHRARHKEGSRVCRILGII